MLPRIRVTARREEDKKEGEDDKGSGNLFVYMK